MRVSLARSMVTDCDLLLLDEPFAGVDPIAVLDIQNIISQLVELNMGILITDHNVRKTLGICDRAYVLKEGQILTHGNAQDIVNNKDVRKYYLGEDFSL